MKNKYLHTGIISNVNQRLTVFMLHASNKILIFFEKDTLISFYPGYVLYFITYHDTQFISFPKIEKATFTNQFDLLIF